MLDLLEQLRLNSGASNGQRQLVNRLILYIIQSNMKKIKYVDV